MPEQLDPALQAKIDNWTWETAKKQMQTPSRSTDHHLHDMRAYLGIAAKQMKGGLSKHMGKLHIHHQGNEPGALPYPDSNDFVLPPDAQQFLHPVMTQQTSLYQNTQSVQFLQTLNKKNKKVAFRSQSQANQKSAYQRLEDRKVTGKPAWGSRKQHPDTKMAFSEGDSGILRFRLKGQVWRLPTDQGSKGWGVINKSNLSVVPPSNANLQRVLQELADEVIYWRYPSGGRFDVLRDMEVCFNIGWDNWAGKIVAKNLEIAGSNRRPPPVSSATPDAIPPVPKPVANPLTPALKRMKFSAVIESMPREGMGAFGWGKLREGWQSWEGQAAHRQAKAALRGWTIYIPPTSVKASKLTVGSRILCHLSWDPTNKAVFANHIRLQEDA